MEALPEVAPPVEKPPAAVQDVAYVELQVSVEDWPLSMVLGFAESVAVGALDSEHEAVVPPPEPSHDHVHEPLPLTLLTLVPSVQP
mgnify:CR=1 FL=1